MTLIEAIKSGKRFKRTGDGSWHVPLDLSSPDFLRFTFRDVLSDDWEIKEEEITITRSQFFNGVRDAMIEHMSERKLVWVNQHAGENELTNALARYWRHISGEKN